MKFAVAFVILLAIGAFATRPGAAALDEMIVSDLQVEAANLGVGEGDDVISGLARLACSVSAAECARLIRAGMTIEVSELYVARSARVAFGDDPALRCLGVFTQWTCRPLE